MTIRALFPEIEPTLNLDFANSRRLDPRVTFTRNSVGTYVDQSGVLRTAGVNEPRFDHDPETGESLGLLIEEQRTNSIRNNTMVGAVVGTPGTLPTNWLQNSLGTGLTSQVVATGTQSGIAYIDIRVSGTAGDTVGWSLNFDTNTAIAASSGQAWTGSAYIAIIGGTLNGTANQFIRVIERDGAGGYSEASIASWSSAGSAFSTASRLSAIRPSMGGTASFVQLGVYFTSIIGQAIDITLRIGLPQLEQGAFTTSVIPTSGTTVPRQADVAQMTGTDFSSWYNQSEGTFYSKSKVIGFNTTSAGVNYANGIFKVREAASASFSRTHHYHPDTGRILIAGGRDSSGISFNSTGMTSLANIFYKAASSYVNASMTGAVSVNGVTPVPSSTVITLNSIDRLIIGAGYFGLIANTYDSDAMFLNGHIASLRYYPTRLSDATLQALTAG